MNQPPNRIPNFWQELKRRKVVRVITVYAAAAFVILELVDIITEPFGLPDWTMILVVVLLAVGLIITVIISWIYDIHPEGGIVKTESERKVSEETAPPSSNSWKIASYISFAVIVGLIVLNVVPRSSNKEILEKSIAVLPFTYLSDEPDKQYLADGTMAEVLLNLSKIKELRVMSKTSVEQYRNTDKTVIEICGELNVAFLLEGSFLKNGDQVRLIVQLIQPGSEGHIWSKKYDRSWKDIFSVQSEVAQLIAGELQAAITPDERKLIEKTPTLSLTAYDFYQRGKDEYVKVLYDKDNREALERAEYLYYKALEYDSTFAQAYIGLADVYWAKHFHESYLSEDFLDSVIILADIALSFDDKLAEGYTVRGYYFEFTGNKAQAIEEYNRAIYFNPNDWKAYAGKGLSYMEVDLVKSIDNLYKAASLNHGPELPALLINICGGYHYAGFIEKGNDYNKEALKLNGDSVYYYLIMAVGKRRIGDYEEALEFVKKGYALDSTSTYILGNLGRVYMYLEQYEKSLKYFEKYIERHKALGDSSIHTMEIGYVYWQNGYKDKADYHFNESIKNCNRLNELERRSSAHSRSYYDLASVYAFRGENDKAFENLIIFNQKEQMHISEFTNIKHNPLFERIRDQPEFQQIVRDVEAKYQAEHERVRQWLEENDML